MCRIFGAINDRSVGEDKLLRASEAMFSGGPDSQWIEQGDGWSVGTNRLAIQGIDGGNLCG
jgi:asparagine synthase (glutamine-hydrolysing)